MKTLNFTVSALLVLCCSASAFAQKLNPEVIGTGGGFYSSASGSLSITVGEMTAVNTISKSAGIFTQGFQQPLGFTTGIETYAANTNFTFFPNPVSSDLFVEANTENPEAVEIHVFSAIGQTITVSTLQKSEKIWVLNVRDLPEGLYFVQVKSGDNTNSFSIRKTD